MRRRSSTSSRRRHRSGPSPRAKETDEGRGDDAESRLRHGGGQGRLVAEAAGRQGAARRADRRDRDRQGDRRDGSARERDARGGRHAARRDGRGRHGDRVPRDRGMTVAGTLVPQTRMRKAIARRMSDSKRDAPHFYVSTEIEMDAVSALVAEESERAGSRITATAALVRACVVALRENPRLNSIWTEEGLLQSEDINPGVAIALDEGLIAPALVGADGLDLQATAAALDDLAARARNGKLTAAEVSDATFTLSNLGMFQVSAF